MKVLDADGNELRIGSVVRRRFRGGIDGGINGVVTWVGRQVDVTFIRGWPVTYPAIRERIFGRTRICADLVKHALDKGKPGQ